MQKRNSIHELDSIFTWISRLAYINILAVIFTLLGIVVLGLFPALFSIFSLSRKISKGEEIRIMKDFRKAYFRDFLSSNILGYTLVIIGSILYINYKAILNSADTVFFGTIVAFYILTILYVVILIWLFPLYAEYQNTIFEYLKNSLIIGLVNIHYTLLILLILFFLLYISLKIPSLFLFFTFSLGIIIWYSIANKVFEKINSKEIN